MITNKNKSKIIIQYFKGDLDGDLKLEFLKKYEEDESFRKEVDQFKTIKETFSSLSHESENRIVAYLDSKAKADNETTKTFKLGNYSRTLSIAASIAAIVAIGVYLAINNNPTQLTEGKKIPVYQPENLGFTENTGIPNDTIVLFVDTKKGLDGYYQFSDTLILFFKSEEILNKEIYMRISGGISILAIGESQYLIKRGLDKPRKLEVYQE